MRRGAAEQHEKHYKEDVLGKCGGFRWSSLSISVRMGMVAMQAYRAVFLRCRLLPMA